MAEYEITVSDTLLSNLLSGGKEGLAVLALPEKYHRRLMKSANMQEWLIQEIQRRKRVIRIFPNEASAHRLIGALLAEIHEEQQGDGTWT